MFGVGIFAASECWGMRVERNRFLHDAPTRADVGRVARSDAGEPGAGTHLLVGLLLAPSLVYRSQRTELAVKLPSGALVRALLTRGRIRENEFSGLTAAGVIFAELGDVRIEDNTVRDSYAGFALLSLRSLAFADLAGEYTVAGSIRDETLSQIGQVLVAGAADPAVIAISVLARTYPLPAAFISGSADRVIAAHMVAELTQGRPGGVDEAVRRPGRRAVRRQTGRAGPPPQGGGRPARGAQGCDVQRRRHA